MRVHPAESLARMLYTLVLRLAVPLYVWRVWTRGLQEPTYRARWWERLGLYGRAHLDAVRTGRALRPLIWVHAVSLGETRAASALIDALRARAPGMRLLLTHGTATGRAAGQGLLSTAHGDLQTWLPFDTPGAVRRFLRLHRPDVGVLMETEVWPVLQHEAAVAGVPMVLANARLSDKSLRQGLRFAWLLRPAARALRLILAQTRDDAARLQALTGDESVGGPPVWVAGNVKFDMTLDDALIARGYAWRLASQRPIVLAASTREGEEAGLLQAWRQSAECVPGARPEGAAGQPGQPAARLLIVPRHPQRFDEVAALVRSSGASLSRRSEWHGDVPDAAALKADVWLGDSMREMAAYYVAARVALLGGSFAPLGGQNLIEAAACGCPLVMGPSTFNFAEAAMLSEQAGAARRATGWDEGARMALSWIQEAQADVDATATRCRNFAGAHRGAAASMADAILGVARG